MAEPPVPSLDDLATAWLAVADLAHMPSLHNFHRMAVCAPDLLGVSLWTGPEDLFVRMGRQFIEHRSYPRLVLAVDGVEPLATECRWFAYQAVRRASVRGVAVTTTVRMEVEGSGVLTEIRVRDERGSGRDVELQVAGLGWLDAGAATSPAFVHAGPGRLVTLLVDPPEAVALGGGGGARWRLRLGPGGEGVVRLAQAEAPTVEQAVARAEALARDHGAAWREVRRRWDQRWADTFTPGNPHFSGHVPVFVTTDDALRRLYYTAVLTMLVLHRTNLRLCDRVFVTSGERATGTVFLWDTSMCSRLLSLWEPSGLRRQVRLFLSLDPFAGALVNLDTGDFLGAQAVPGGPGAWYAANHMALFRLVYDYVAVTGDDAFLDEEVSGRSVLAHLDALATAWRGLVPDPEVALADYGDVDNLLECVPTYVHRVASLNAADVWMLRTVADLHRRRGDVALAAERAAEAERIAAAVLSLYLPGEGVWCCLDAQGHRQPVRHCYDFICTGTFLADLLPESTRAEMASFVERELLTVTWMRAMSLRDPAAAVSDRPDHGPFGAFGAWPALAAETLFDIDRFAAGTDLLRRVSGALGEGVVGQAYELWGPARDAPDAPVRIAARGFCLREGSAAGAFAEAIISSVFGFRPRVGEADPIWRPDEPRPTAGTLHHLRWAGREWRLSLGPTGVGRTPEERPGGAAVSPGDAPMP